MNVKGSRLNVVLILQVSVGQLQQLGVKRTPQLLQFGRG